MVAVKSFAAGCALWFAALLSAGAHDAHDVSKTVDPHAARMNLPPQVAQHANAEPMPERRRAALDAG